MPFGRRDSYDLLSRIAIQSLPAVSLDLQIPFTDIPCVRSDNTQSIYRAIDYFVAEGKKKFAYFCVFNGMNDNETERFHAFCRRLVAHRIPLRQEFIVSMNMSKFSSFRTEEAQSGWQIASAEEQLARFLSMRERPEVLFFLNDISAANFLETLRANKPEIIPTISIVGFDDLNISAKNNFTSIRQNFSLIGRKAVALLVQRIANPWRHFRDISINTKLIIREST